MGNSSVWLNFNPSKIIYHNKISYHSQKEHRKISNIAKSGREMLQNTENITLRNMKMLYRFPLCAESCT